MGLPQSMDYVATEGAPIRPQTWNKIQQAIVGGAHGPLTLLIPAAAGQPTLDGGGPIYADVDSTINGFSPGFASADSGIYRVEIPIVLHAGDRILSITLWIAEADSETLNVEVFEVNPAAQTKVKKGEKSSGATDAIATLGFDSSDANFPLTLLDDRLYVLTLTFPSTTTDREIRVPGAKVVYDKPA